MKNIIKCVYNFIFILATIILFTTFSKVSVNAKDKDGDYVIILDPGHGCGYIGATSLSGLNEVDINWNIALSMKAELETYSGVKVYLVRGSSNYINNVARARTGESLGADYFFSLHNNYDPDAIKNGVVCYGSFESQYSYESEQLGRAISDEIHKLGLNYSEGGYLTRKGEVRPSEDYYTVINEAVKADILPILIEHCFLNYPSDSEFISITNNQYKLGLADATAVAKHLNLKKRTVKPGSEISLIRTYSALIEAPSGSTFLSSDKSIVNVENNGQITAMKSGSATITCTIPDGSKHTVKVTIPPVKLIGIVGSTNVPTHKTKQSAYAYQNNIVVVNGLYSDGSASIISSGYTLGDIVEDGRKDYISDDYSIYLKVPITYKDFKSYLRLEYGPKAYSGDDDIELIQTIGTNSDIAFVPTSFKNNDSSYVEPTTESGTEESVKASALTDTGNQEKRTNALILISCIVFGFVLITISMFVYDSRRK